MVPACEDGPAEQRLSEARVQQGVLIDLARLVQQLEAVRDEQQPQVSLVLLAQTPVVEGRHDRLAGAGDGDEEVAVPVVDLTLGVQPVEHLALRTVRHVPGRSRLGRLGRLEAEETGRRSGRLS